MSISIANVCAHTHVHMVALFPVTSAVFSWQRLRLAAPTLLPGGRADTTAQKGFLLGRKARPVLNKLVLTGPWDAATSGSAGLPEAANPLFCKPPHTGTRRATERNESLVPPRGSSPWEGRLDSVSPGRNLRRGTWRVREPRKGEHILPPSGSITGATKSSKSL